MKEDFDLDRIADIPDPMPGLATLTASPRRAMPFLDPPTRSHVVVVRYVALVVALLYQGMWLVVFNKRGDLDAVPRTTLFMEIAIPTVAAMLALTAAISPGERGMGAPKGRLTVLVWMAPIVFLVATLFGGPADVDGESFWPHALRCFMLVALFSAAPLALACWAFRRAFVGAPAWRVAALAMACAATGATTMSFLCSQGSPVHVLVGHGGMLLVAGLGGAALGRRLGEA
ncbi:MAG: NrsF family protein [Myxococcota bacterium]|nr:NrsF family protein [Myxococcota bacterium]